jgi:hypothetical protein
MPDIRFRCERCGAEYLDLPKGLKDILIIEQNTQIEIKDAMLEAYREMTDCLIANFKQLTNSINQGRLK